jgi:hypothetical protein
MVEPVENAKEIVKYSIQIDNCELFLMDIDKEIESDNWREIGLYLKDMNINTKQRVRKYLDYNLALSGGVYGSSPSDWNKESCSEEIQKVLEEMGL